MGILREAIRRRRRHAGFFSWFDRSPGGKALAETGAVGSLLESMAASGQVEYSRPRASSTDWPDCEVDSLEGKVVAFEVTELVDPLALSRRAPSRPWSEQEMVTRLATLLGHKDERSFDGGKYAEVVLLIHTDELYLDPDRAAEFLDKHRFSLKHHNISRAFLLFSYLPQLERCPFLELRLAP